MMDQLKPEDCQGASETVPPVAMGLFTQKHLLLFILLHDPSHSWTLLILLSFSLFFSWGDGLSL